MDVEHHERMLLDTIVIGQVWRRMIGAKVPGWGNIPNKYMLVGEGPGRVESQEGIPFCGPSGSELDWLYLFHGAKMRREDFYITNIVKWRTDEKDSDPTKEDIARDEPELLAEIQVVNPDIIVAVGKIAAAWFLQTAEPDLEKYFGVPVPCPRFPDKTLLITYHPAAALRLPERYIDKIYWSFQQLGKLCRGEIDVAEDQYQTVRYEQGFGFHSGGYSGPIGVDTEGGVELPWGVSYSCQEGAGSVIKAPIKLFKVDHPVLHNALYDLGVLEAMKVGINPAVLDDTMLMAYLFPWLPKGLKPLAFKLCGMEQESYEETIGPASEKIAKDFLERATTNRCEACGGAGETKIPYKRPQRCPSCKNGVRDEDVITQVDGYWDPDGVCRDCGGTKYLSKFRTERCLSCKGDCTGWPQPAPQLVFDGNYSGKLYKPQSIGRRIRTLLERGTRLREGWAQIDQPLRQVVEDQLGVMKEATLDDIEPNKAIHYSARDADATLRVYHKLEPVLKKEGLWNVYQIDKGIIPIIDRMHTNGILIDIDYFHTLEEEFSREQMEVIDKLSSKAGFVLNPGSWQQVGELLYHKYGLKGFRGSEATDEKTLETLKIKYGEKRPEIVEIIDLITDYRELDKLLGTYVRPLPRAADKYGRVHTKFLLHVTNTGRLASRDPNLQNQPTRTDRGKLIRRGFIAKEGCVLASDDLDQIELRVGAHITEDPNMIDVFLTGKDIHRATASLVYKKPFEEVSQDERRAAKTINFGIFYGMSANRLRNELALMGIYLTLDECKQLLVDWFAAYPGVNDYMERMKNQARSIGYVECLFGRRRYVPGVYSTIDKIREESFRWATNFPVQATAAGLLKLWMSSVWKSVIPVVASMGYCEPLLTVHDELIFEVEEGLDELLMSLVVAEAAKTAELLVPISAKGASAKSWDKLK